MFHSPLSMPGSFKFSILPPFRNAKQFPGFNLVLGSSFQDHGEPYFTMCTLVFLFKNESVSSSVDSGLFFKHFDRCFVDFSTFEHDVRHPQKVFNPQQKCLPNIEDCPIQSHFEFYNQTKGQSMFYTVWGYFFSFSDTSYYLTRNESEIV